MRIVIVLGDNAQLRRGELQTSDNRRHNVQRAVAALAPLARGYQLVITHGNGPQVGLLALRDPCNPIDALDAETEGRIGYLFEQSQATNMPNKRCAALITRVEVDPLDKTFVTPGKPIGSVYTQADTDRLSRERGWTIVVAGAHCGEWPRHHAPKDLSNWL